MAAKVQEFTRTFPGGYLEVKVTHDDGLLTPVEAAARLNGQADALVDVAKSLRRTAAVLLGARRG